MSKKAAKKPGTELTVKKDAGLPATAGLPSFLTGYTGMRGTEGIESADITIPRVKVGQSMSDEVKSGSIKEGALFLNITSEVLAEPGSPLEVVLLARSKEFILWRPREDNGGGILARAKPVQTSDGVRYQWDKPNTSFEVKVGGKVKVTWKTKKFIDEDGLDQWGSEIPGDEESGIAATAHHNYVVMLPKNGNMVAAMSLSKSQVKKAKDWNAILKLSPAPIFARRFNVTTVDEKNDQGDFKNFDVKPAGFVEEADFANIYKPAAMSFVGKVINVDHSDGDDTSTDERL